MGKTIISSKILKDPVQMMTVTLIAIEELAKDKGLDPTPIKECILSAESIFDIQQILDKNFPDEIIIDA
jgi:hypothetical protein